MDNYTKLQVMYFADMMRDWLWEHYCDNFCQDCPAASDGDCVTGFDPADDNCPRWGAWDDVVEATAEFAERMVRRMQ